MSQVVATGGDEVFDITENGVDYRVHRWTTVGSSDPFVVTAGGEVEYLVVAGGGGGGGRSGGGGGAGGLVEGLTELTAGTISVAVGAGGNGGAPGQGSNGSDSTFGTIAAIGGGGGGGQAASAIPGLDGGSGGGRGRSGAGSSSAGGVGLQPASASGGFGNDGFGIDLALGSSGGGGGAGAAGTGFVSTGAAGNGGAGRSSSITGVLVGRAGGGGGGGTNTASSFASDGGGAGGVGSEVGFAATPNTGGGGGGGGDTLGFRIGGAGGSGVVIIRYVLFPVVPYSPDPTVTIAGQDFTAATLETVRITRGRTDIFAEPRAGYAICELIDLTGNGLGIQPLQSITITIKDRYGDSLPVFTGNVSDTAAVLYDTGFESGQPGAIITVIAVGPLAKLNRRVIGAGGFDEQPDGDRIAAIVAAGLGARWEETPGTWANAFTATTAWEDVDPGLDLDLIDQPGDFTIATLDPQAGGYSALGQAYFTANSGRGVIYDTADGFIAYADAQNRRDAADNGYLPIDPALLIAARLNVTSTQADITNRTIVEFDGGTVVFTDVDSIIDYGVLAKQFQTNLASSSQAEAWALDYLEDHRRPTVKVSGAAIRLDQLFTDSILEGLLDLDVNSPVLLTGIPTTMGVRQFPAFVEGVDWSINRQTATLILNVSDAALSIGSQQWNQVDPTLEWGDVSATLSWIDAVEVTA